MNRVIYAVALMLLSWLLMQAVHELGHVVGACAVGGTVQRVVLHPLTISRTDVVGDARPLVTVWCGPLFGALLPLLSWCFAGRCPWPLDQALRFFAGFCLIANGGYLAYGWFAGIGDAGELLKHGSPVWTLWLFGAIAIPAGLGIWHRLGHRLGLGPATLPIAARHALSAWLCLGVVVLFEFCLSSR